MLTLSHIFKITNSITFSLLSYSFNINVVIKLKIFFYLFYYYYFLLNWLIIDKQFFLFIVI